MDLVVEKNKEKHNIDTLQINIAKPYHSATRHFVYPSTSGKELHVCTRVPFYYWHSTVGLEAQNIILQGGLKVLQ